MNNTVIAVHVSCITTHHYAPADIHYTYTRLFSNSKVAQQWIDLQPKFNTLYKEEIEYVMKADIVTDSFTEEEIQKMTTLKAEKDDEIQAYYKAEEEHYSQEHGRWCDNEASETEMYPFGRPEPTAEDCWDGDSSDSD